MLFPAEDFAEKLCNIVVVDNDSDDNVGIITCYSRRKSIHGLVDPPRTFGKIDYKLLISFKHFVAAKFSTKKVDEGVARLRGYVIT
jgi:hypothetical protein